jgi:uncharacterized lipoprotein YmbA
MESTKIKGFFTAMLATIMVFLWGCGHSLPSRFYVLTPTATASPDAPSDFTVGINSIKFADYLLRPRIVTQLEANRLDYAEYDRWAESFDENFTRVVMENLSRLLASTRVYTFPWPSSLKIHYGISLEITRFVLGPDRRITLVTFWDIHDPANPEKSVRKKSILSRPVQQTNPLDYTAMVEMMNRLIETLCEEIAAELKSLAGR